MTPEEYIARVEALGREASGSCWGSNWREYLENIYVKDGELQIRTECTHTDCKTCVPCKRCGKLYDSTIKFSRHGSAGDFENWPEVYIAEVLHEPWYNSEIIRDRPYSLDLLEPGALVMIEEDIVNGLNTLLAKYPNLIAWVSMEPIYYACLARMPRLIALLTDWMERRNTFFTPSGEYGWMSRSGENYTDWDIWGGIRLDLPPIARDGEHNIPNFLIHADFRTGDINLAHGIRYVLEKTNEPHTLAPIYARALASNTKFWQSLECASMNNYETLSKFIACISHWKKADGTVVTIKPDRWGGSTPMTDSEHPTQLVWHTLKTRCLFCVLDTHEGHTEYCSTCLPTVPIEPIAKTPYECVIAGAAAIRRRRLRGVFRCAAILVGKARQLHYMPPCGQYYLEAKAHFEANVSV